MVATEVPNGLYWLIKQSNNESQAVTLWKW